MFPEHLQGRWLNYLPKQPIPAPDHSFREEIFPNIQPEPPLAQLEAIPSHPVSSYTGKEADLYLITISFHIVIEGNKVSPESPLLQTEQSQFPQPLPIRLVLQTHSSTSTSFLQWRAQNWTWSLRFGLISAEYSRTITSLLLATLFLKQYMMPLALLATWAHCWLCLVEHQPTPPDPFPPHSLSATLPQACSVVRDCCVQSAGPGTWSCWISSHWLQPRDPACPDPSEGRSYSQADQRFFPTWCHLQTYWGCTQCPRPGHQNDIKQDRPQYQRLGSTTHVQTPAGFNSIHHHSVGLAIQPVLYPVKSVCTCPSHGLPAAFCKENTVGDCVNGFAEL